MLAPCPRCGGRTLEEEATGAAEIRGVGYQTCWIEFKTCGWEGPEVELNDGPGPSDYQLVRDAWNEAAWGVDWQDLQRLREKEP